MNKNSVTDQICPTHTNTVELIIPENIKEGMRTDEKENFHTQKVVSIRATAGSYQILLLFLT